MKTKILFSIIIFCLFMFRIQKADAQTTKHVLFLGNSYTYVNNLPQLIADIALSNGDTLIFDSNTPGGYTLELHSIDPISLNKIAMGGWDYVVLQEQSQLPSFDPSQVATDVLPYAQLLNNLINASDSCTETLFYMTWGRKNGDASNCAFYPPVCTYEGMQERLRQSYLLMAQLNHATVVPVGAAWREVRLTNPAFDLYQADESHPSIYGSYLAACAFYEAIFGKSVLNTSYTNILTATEADLIKNKVHTLFKDSIILWADSGDIAISSFNYNQFLNYIQFNSTALNALNYSWSFGDGTYSTLSNPVHTYTTPGTFGAQLTVSNNCFTSTYTDSVLILLTGVEKTDFVKPQLLLVNDEVRIEHLKNGKYNFQIYNTLGSLVLEEDFIIPGKSVFKLNGGSGIYIIKLTDTQSGFCFNDKLMMK